jgi:hypothetical protein
MKKIGPILLLCCLLWGCHGREAADVASHIVTEISVTCQYGDQLAHRYYNTHEKMQQILLYLRAVSPGFTPKEDPDALKGTVVHITLHRADGSVKVYRQKEDRYLQEENGSWKQIKAEWGADLWRILWENESDPKSKPPA